MHVTNTTQSQVAKKYLIVYDSLYGNTKKLAGRIADSLGTQAKTIYDATTNDVREADLVIFGSPTQGGRPTKPMQAFIDSLNEQVMRDKHVATFDSRFAYDEHSKALGIIMKMVDFAAPRMADSLVKKGAQPIGEPEGFFVHDTKGPVNNGELERAEKWALRLSKV